MLSTVLAIIYFSTIGSSLAETRMLDPAPYLGPMWVDTIECEDGAELYECTISYLDKCNVKETYYYSILYLLCAM